MKYRISKDHCIPDQMQGICSQQIASQQLQWFRYWPLRCRIQQFPARKVAYWKPLKVRTFSEKQIPVIGLKNTRNQNINTCKFSVHRNTPPKATSSPNINADSSRESAVSRALLIDWNIFSRVVGPSTGAFSSGLYTKCELNRFGATFWEVTAAASLRLNEIEAIMIFRTPSTQLTKKTIIT